MGKGDKKTKRGKIVNRSYGVRRPRKSSATVPVKKAEAEVVVAKPEKAPAEPIKKAKKAAVEGAPKAKKPKKGPEA